MSKRWPDKTVIGLTGNIATGKSVVRRMLEHLGVFSIDADSLVHRAMSPGAPAYKPVVEIFGRWILDQDGRVNRKRLGKIVFSDELAMGHLERVTHPIVNQVLDILIKRSDKDVVVIEAIKLIEAGIADDCDSVWVIDAPTEVRLKRLTTNRELTEEEARQRMDVQSPQSEKLARADRVINNADGYELTYQQVQNAYNQLLGIEEEEEEEAVITTSAAGAPAEALPVDAEIEVLRGGPKQAEAIAGFINQQQDVSLNRTDVLMRFGQKAYMLAVAGGQVVALAGWQVENLIARVDEFMLLSGMPAARIVHQLTESIEQAANDLQSEIVLIFLSNSTPDAVKDALLEVDYEVKTAADLRVPDWREAAEQSAPPNTFMVYKRLREDRVLKPI